MNVADTLDNVAIRRKDALWYSRVRERATGKNCHLVLFPDGVAWRPLKWGVDLAFPKKTGFRFIPLSAITQVKLQPARVVFAKIMTITWSMDGRDPCTVDFELSWAYYWVKKLNSLGIPVVNASLAVPKSLRGFVDTFGFIILALSVVVCFMLAPLAIPLADQRSLLIAFVVGCVVIPVVFFVGERLIRWLLYGRRGGTP
jgi:hypothetical protein